MTMTDPTASSPATTPAGEPGLDRGARFGAASPGAMRLPQSGVPRAALDDEEPGGRHWWFWLIIVAAVAGVGAGCFFFGRHVAPGPGPQVVGVRQGLVAGSPVTAADLTLVHVTAPPRGALTSLQAAIGHTILQNVPVGAVVTKSDVGDTAAAFPRGHQTLVGVSVKPGQEPASGLVSGEFVIAIEQPPSQDNKPVKPVQLTFATQIVAVANGSDGTQSVTLSVPSSEATMLGVQAAAGNVALVQVAVP
jgi:hypothetical protein